MEFATTPTQDAVLEAVDHSAARHLPPAAVRRRDREHLPPYDLLSAMGEAGFFRPACIFALPDLPRTGAGKMLTAELAALLTPRLARRGNG